MNIVTKNIVIKDINNTCVINFGKNKLDTSK